MKNLYEVPKGIKLRDIIQETEDTKDYTTTVSIQDSDILNLPIRLQDIIDVQDSMSNVCLIADYVPFPSADEETFVNLYNTLRSDSIFKIINYSNNDPNLPITDWYPTTHTEPVSPDGTIVINTYQPDNTSLDSHWHKYYAPTHRFELFLFDSTTTDSTSYCNIVDINRDFQLHKAAISGELFPEDHLVTVENLYNSSPALSPNFRVNIEPSSHPTSILSLEECGYPVFRHIPQTRDIYYDNDIIEWDMNYIFTEDQWINKIHGYLLYSFLYKDSNLCEPEPENSTSYNYYTFLDAMIISGDNFFNGDNNDGKSENYTDDVVYITVSGFDVELDTLVVLGYRSFESMDVIDLSTIPIKPCKISEIKVNVKETLDNDTGESANKYNKEHHICGICTQFVPSWDTTLTGANDLFYIDTMDTPNFAKFKSLETQTKSITPSFGMQTINLDYYLYNMNFDPTTNTFSFNINENSYRHHALLGRNSIKGATVMVIDYDLNDTSSLNDATILESVDVTNINLPMAIQFDTTDVLNKTVNVELIYDTTFERLLNNYIMNDIISTDFNNYEYDYKWPIKDTVNYLKYVDTYTYDATSTESQIVTKQGTSVLVHKAIDVININRNDSNNINAYVQALQIGSNTLLDKQLLNFDGTTYSWDSTISSEALLFSTIKNVSLDMTRNPATEYIMFNVILVDSEVDDVNQIILTYNTTYKFKRLEINNINEIDSIINDPNLYHYATYYQSKV